MTATLPAWPRCPDGERVGRRTVGSARDRRPPPPPLTADARPDEGEILQERPDRPVVRIGDVVRHPRQPWSVSVHALLAHLAEAGLTEAPRPGPVVDDHDDVAYIE